MSFTLTCVRLMLITMVIMILHYLKTNTKVNMQSWISILYTCCRIWRISPFNLLLVPFVHAQKKSLYNFVNKQSGSVSIHTKRFQSISNKGAIITLTSAFARCFLSFSYLGGQCESCRKTLREKYGSLTLTQFKVISHHYLC